MNYLAHLFLAQPTDHSLMGNLLGDFVNGTDLNTLPDPVVRGVHNHRAIDAYTDSHPVVKDLRKLFSPERRRFAGIILDVVFDHYLLKHWGLYSEEPFDSFLERSYNGLQRTQHLMPERMQQVVGGMLEYRWLDTYRDLEGVGYALDRMAQRIRLENKLPGAVQELWEHYQPIETGFRHFFPLLMDHVSNSKIEIPNKP